MRGPFVTSTLALMLALAPAALFAQDPPTQPPTQQPPTQPPAAELPEQAAEAKVSFTSPAGMLLVQIKPAETAAFEEMAGRIKASIAKAEDPVLRQQGEGLKIFKAAEPFGGNTLYLISVDPVVPGAEYEPFAMILKTMDEDEQRDPATQEMWKRFQSAFAAGMGKLSLTPVGGGI
ncbi:hypothetical protein BH23ACI1_BH23ACI1_22820 [soil metagenome]|nr:hypothetical protein [Acidobacteriota bacterium]